MLIDFREGERGRERGRENKKEKEKEGKTPTGCLLYVPQQEIEPTN